MAMVMKSPNQLLEQACEVMLDGKSPETEEDWARVVNCWAANLPIDLMAEEVRLLVMILQVPLTNTIVKDIINFQKERR